MSFARKLLWATVAVAVVVGLGFAWRATPAADLVAFDRDHERHERDERAGREGSEGFDQREERRRATEAGMFHLDQLDDLAGSLLQPAILVTLVAVADGVRRRRANARRLTAAAPAP